MSSAEIFTQYAKSIEMTDFETARVLIETNAIELRKGTPSFAEISLTATWRINI